jgi:hypothetical protein
VFFHEVMSLCEAQDNTLLKLPCYKNIGSLTGLRKAAMRALAACHYITSQNEKIFNTLYQALERNNPELQEAAFHCIKTFVAGSHIDINMVGTKLNGFGKWHLMKHLLFLFINYYLCLQNVTGKLEGMPLCFTVETTTQ